MCKNVDMKSANSSPHPIVISNRRRKVLRIVEFILKYGGELATGPDTADMTDDDWTSLMGFMGEFRDPSIQTREQVIAWMYGMDRAREQLREIFDGNA